MNQLVKAGKRNTLLLAASILLVSLHTIWYHHSLVDVDTKKMTQQSIRFILTLVLLFGLYKGKTWARTLCLVLFSISVIGGVTAIVYIENDIAHKIPLMVVVLVYGVAIYHVGFSKSFKAFYHHQKGQQQ
jgi:hypothetical protein